MRLGLIARADDGGLSTMTVEFARHLHPQRVLIMDLGAVGKGTTQIDRITDHCVDVSVCNSYPHIDMRAITWLLDGIDVLYSAETWYWPQVEELARARGVKTVLHSMPELHGPDILADQVWVPTNWEVDRIPTAKVMPVPVALDRFPFVPKERPEVFLHIAASAMLDRNGTDVVLGALPLINSQITVAFQGIDGNLINPASPAAVEVRPPIHDYWEATANADVLVLPRRYAGLSLPMQEAFGRGMPIITTDLMPQNQWPGVMTVPVSSPRPTPMKGGIFNVWDVAPNSVAHAIETMSNNPGSFKDLSREARWFAESISWEKMAPVYTSAFEDLLA